MICFGYKGGIGTSSRRAGPYIVGALVQCNCGRRDELRIAGVPVAAPAKNVAFHADQPGIREERGSIIIVVATDAPLLPHQMKRVARRAGLGLARMGATSSNFSGDIFVAFSTANPDAAADKENSVRMLANQALDPIFSAVVESVEEAITNAFVAATTMTGYQGHRVEALPHAAIQEALLKHGRRTR
jgi:D-aminopeptidase